MNRTSKNKLQRKLQNKHQITVKIHKFLHKITRRTILFKYQILIWIKGIKSHQKPNREMNNGKSLIIINK
jgi:hypothetical protein